MIAPVILLIFSTAGIAVALIMPGLADLIMLAGPCALASLFLLLSAYFRGRVRRSQASKKWMVVDGSNVMHWAGGTPDIATVREVVDHLSGLGFTPKIAFDANAGYKLSGKYQDDHALGRFLGLPHDRVMVVPKGSPADPTILATSRDLRARIVTNDRFRDWAEAYPEASGSGYLIRGVYRTGKLWLDLPARS